MNTQRKKTKKALIVNKKAIVSGNMTEIYEYETPIAIRLQKEKRRIGIWKQNATEEEIKQVQRKNALESYYSFLRKAVLNFGIKGTKFLTLTFKNTNEFDVTNVQQCNKRFTRFIDRFKKKIKKKYNIDLKYIATIEFQDENNRGAVHYHLMLNIPYIKQTEIAESWKDGFITIRYVHNAQQAVLYVGKYMRKGYIDKRLEGKKKFWSSQNLAESEELYNENADKIEEELIKKVQKEKYFEKRYFSEYHQGYITYKCYYTE